MFRSGHFRFLFSAVLVASVTLLSVSVTVSGQLFYLADYPGGSTSVTYELIGEDNDQKSTVKVTITPVGEDNYKTTMTFEGVEKRKDLVLSLFSVFFVGMQHQLQENMLDLGPLQWIDEKEVKPNKSEPYRLTPGTLETMDVKQIAGIEVVMANYTHQSYPDQQAVLGIPNVETRKLLPFLPLFRLEKKVGDQWQVTNKVKLTEFERNH